MRSPCCLCASPPNIFVFHAIHVISKRGGLLIHPITSCLVLHCLILETFDVRSEDHYFLKVFATFVIYPDLNETAEEIPNEGLSVPPSVHPSIHPFINGW
jgi:hypothetical protein